VQFDLPHDLPRGFVSLAAHLSALLCGLSGFRVSDFASFVHLEKRAKATAQSGTAAFAVMISPASPDFLREVGASAARCGTHHRKG
jgi:hypothetical protein